MKKKHLYTIAVALLSLTLAAPSVYSQQERGGEQRARFKSRLDQQRKEDRVRMRSFEPEAEILALEEPVDPEEYIVGAGDKFFINITSIDEEGMITDVTAEGKLIIPTLGVFSVADKILADVQKTIRAAGRKKYKKTRIYANLVGLRSFRVHVVGEVMDPGVHIARQTYRLSDALTSAGGVTDWANLAEIEIQRRGEEPRTVDYTSYENTGNLEANPTLLDGDVIRIKRVDAQTPAVRIEGRINRPGIYFARPGETAADLLHRVKGLTRKDDLRAAVLKRYDDNENAYTVMPVRRLDHSANGTPNEMNELRNGDIISIPSINDSVYVQGAVLHPGAYPYFAGFLARDYAGLAGPNEKAGGLEAIRVRHVDTKKTVEGPDEPVRPGDTVEVKTATRLILKDYLTSTATVIVQIVQFFLIYRSLQD